MSGGEPFLKRWSRLKNERRDEPKAEPKTEPKIELEKKPEQQAKAVAEPERGAKPPPPEEAGDPDVIAKLPPLESLGQHSDYTPFMREGVPQSLRLAALRKLWVSDPSWAGPDVLDLHNLDYTHLAAPGQVVTTSYQVGRGFVDKVEEAIERVGEERAKDAAKAAEPVQSAEPAEPIKAADDPKPEANREGQPKQPA